MKRTLAVLLIFVGSTAFAHSTPSCKNLVQNTVGIVTLTPITSATNPIQAGANMLFSAETEGVDIGMCAARVTVHGGKLVIVGIQDVLEAGKCIVVGATDLLGAILHDIFGH